MENPEIHTKPEAEITIEDGLSKLTKLAQREARGENVSEELEALVDELTRLNAGEPIISAAIAQGTEAEYGDLDPGRFQGAEGDAKMIPAVIRKQNEGR